MDDVEGLVVFLDQVLDEEERDAAAAEMQYPPPWRVDDDGVLIDGQGDEIAVGEHAEHLARQDPERAYAAIEAKRRIIVLHAQPEHYCVFAEGEDAEDFAVGGLVRGVCLTLRLLAEPYADREGYKEGWKP
jgi:hypothetical protein